MFIRTNKDPGLSRRDYRSEPEECAVTVHREEKLRDG